MDGSLMTMGLLDGVACALLAAAATVRARSFGSHITGALVLGCLCGIIGPLLRESFVHGPIGAGFIARELPGEALVGALGGVAALYVLRKSQILQSRLFNWIDGPGIGMATSVGAITALPELGVVGALTIGLINGLAPGLVRDMALGDTAMLVDKSWYATAAALGCVASIAMFTWLCAGYISDWTASNAEATAVLVGFLVIVVIRAWRSRGQD